MKRDTQKKKLDYMNNEHKWRGVLLAILGILTIAMFITVPIVGILLLIATIWNISLYSKEAEKIRELEWELE